MTDTQDNIPAGDLVSASLSNTEVETFIGPAIDLNKPKPQKRPTFENLIAESLEKEIEEIILDEH